jgi:LacI family transcriptional regulator
VTALLDRQVDGLLFIPCDRLGSAATLGRARARVPVVQLDRSVDDEDADFVGVDNEVGIREVVGHLAASGRTTLALVSSEAVDSTAILRLRAYRDAVTELDPSSADRVLLGSYSVEWGREGARRLLEDGTLPDAIVCGADIIALGVLSAFGEAGVRVPEDVAVTGFDDIGFAAISAPPLTTVRQPAQAIGTEAVRMLEERLGGATGVSQRRLCRPDLVLRRSTGEN